jgi:hypothetical protein
VIANKAKIMVIIYLPDQDALAYTRPMTSEVRHLVQMSDIRGVEIACQNPKCATKIVISVSSSSTQEVPGSCPVCKQAVFDPMKGTWENGRMLRDAIAALARAQVTNVCLEIVGLD